MPLVQAEHLVKSFNSGQSVFRTAAGAQVRAVNDVSLAIEAGETLGLVGESGSGKSTLGRMLLRLVEPDSGTVSFDGNDVLAARGSELRRLRRDMQIIFQDPYGSLDPRMTVEQLVCEPIIIHGGESAAGRQTPRCGNDARRRSGGIGARSLSSRVQRRPAPAYRHCAGAHAPAALYRRGRAGVGARRERGSADREPAAPACRRSFSLPTCLSRTRCRWCATWPIESP